MKQISKYKIDYYLFFLLFIMEFFSLVGIYSSQYNNLLLIKQVLWFFLGIVFIFFIMYIGNNSIYNACFIFYIIGNLLLLLLLFFAPTINNAKCWFKIDGIGSIQISEFMKIILIIFLSKSLYNKNKSDLKIILYSILILLTPFILTFLEPDTGALLMYLIITLSIMFILNISYKWYVYGTILIIILLLSFLFLYFFKINIFIKLLGSSFFLRIERIINWFNKEGMQLNQGIMAISIGGIFGTGLKNNLVYFPESHTDFIFATIASNFGYVGSFILIMTILLFDIRILKLANKCKNKIDSLILVGFVSVIFYQQFQNIGMTFGILPITGITLPFISYGGSSLLSYMIMIGIYMNIYNDDIRFYN